MGLLTATLPVITLQHSKTGQRVTFMAMSHIGPTEFYQACNEIIDQHKDTVLYEGLRQLTSQELNKLSMAHLTMRHNLKNFLSSYETYASLLGWVEEENIIYVDPEQTVNCDISYFHLLSKWIDEEAGDYAVRSNELELRLLQHPSHKSWASHAVRGFTWLTFKISQYSASSYNRSLQQILINHRDRLVVEAIGQIPSGHNPLIIYGASHAPGIVSGLKQQGFAEINRLKLPFYRASLFEVVLGILYLPLEPLLRHAPHWWRRLSRTNQAEPVIELDLTEIDRV